MEVAQLIYETAPIRLGKVLLLNLIIHIIPRLYRLPMPLAISFYQISVDPGPPLLVSS